MTFVKIVKKQLLQGDLKVTIIYTLMGIKLGSQGVDQTKRERKKRKESNWMTIVEIHRKMD